MAYEKEVTKALKPKVASLGFSKEEVKSIAALVAGNLDLTDEATEDEVNEAVENGINSVLPFLKVGQKMATRVVNAARKKSDTDDDDINDDDDTDVDDDKDGKTKHANRSKSDKEPTKLEKALDLLIKQNEALTERLDNIEKGKVSDSRKAKLEKLLKDTGAYGKRTLKNFSLMTFKDDEEFDEFYSEVEDDLKAFNQERTSAGLEKIGPPAVGGGSTKQDEPEKLSDAEVEALANNM